MDDEGSDGRRTLHHIADALGVPVEQLFFPGEPGRNTPAARAEVRALIRAFSRVSDPMTRGLLMRMVEDAARAERSAGGRGV